MVEFDGTARRNNGARAAERVYSVVKERLLEGMYKAGERLQVDAIGAELEVSKQPVMESLRRLSAEGLVVITPQVDCRVAYHDVEEAHDFFHLLAAVEGAAAAMAAVRRSPRELMEAEAINGQIGALREESRADVRAHLYRMLNRSFHSAVHRMCQTPIVESVGSGMYDRADFFINAIASVSPLGAAICERHAEHEEILAMLRAQDADGARQAADAHIINTIGRIESAISANGGRDGNAAS